MATLVKTSYSPNFNERGGLLDRNFQRRRPAARPSLRR
jgi:hypothetical protein